MTPPCLFVGCLFILFMSIMALTTVCQCIVHYLFTDLPSAPFLDYSFLFFFSSTTLLLPTHLPPPSCTHAQSCNPMDFSLPDSCPWIFPGKNTGVGCHFLLHDYDTFDRHSLLSLIFLQTEASLPFLRASFAFSSQSIPLVLLLKRQVPLPSGILL